MLQRRENLQIIIKDSVMSLFHTKVFSPIEKFVYFSIAVSMEQYAVRTFLNLLSIVLSVCVVP